MQNTYSASLESHSYPLLESGKNFALQQVKKIIAPVAPSSVFSNTVKFTSKSMALIGCLKGQQLIPIFSRSLEGCSEILGVTAFLNLAISFIPNVNKDNLDEVALQKSVVQETKAMETENVPQGKWMRRITKQVKNSLDTTLTTGAVRRELQSYLVNKGLGEEQAHQIAQSIALMQKKKSLIETTYSTLFLVPSFMGLYNTLEKWQLITFTAELSTRIGNVPLLGVVARIGIRRIALYTSVVALTLKLGHNSYKLCVAQAVVWQIHDNPDALRKAQEARTKEIWATALAGLSAAGAVVPLVISVNPIGLLAYETFCATLSLVNALR